MLFASDLDNTLIHSHLKAKPGDICVEIKDGKELSFMSPKAYELLRVIRTRCRFVPVTTRSLEQYRRLSLPGNTPLEYALVSHGALLLVNGQVDELWARESQERLKDCLPLLEFYRKHLTGLFPDCRTSDGFFIFAKSENAENAASELKAMVNPRLFSVCGVYNKVYIFPRQLSKGGAVKRLTRRLEEPEGPLVCAGDSWLDLSMLKIADKAIVPGAYPYDGENFARASGGDFSVDVLQAVRKLQVSNLRIWGEFPSSLTNKKIPLK
ncbi:MAG: HAD hydrolase family protein [Synergistaceae bacterium]|nr:HAD hydrolase family protein [Synergistaceae bacterium]